MRILAIGDFHGKFPNKLKSRIKREKPDLILCTGDYANADKIRKLVFKHWTKTSWVDAVGIKRARQLEKETFNSGIKILKKLNSLNVKTFIIWGNTDFYKRDRYLDSKAISPGYFDDKIKKMNNIFLIDRKKAGVKNIVIIGHGGYLDITDYIKHPLEKEKRKQRIVIKRYKHYEMELKKLLSSKNPKNFIFLTHYTPYGIFDKVKFRKSPMNGRHAGWGPYNQIIRRYSPLLCICGHMHEYQGMKKLGKTAIINPGPAYEGKAAVIEIEKDKIKSIRFLK